MWNPIYFLCDSEGCQAADTIDPTVVIKGNLVTLISLNLKERLKTFGFW